LKITAIREIRVPLKTNLRNAAFDFSEMTTSVVAVISDIIRDGQPLIGYAFNSTGRYACGAQMRDRFIPRLLSAKPESLLNELGNNFDPSKILACMMQREKPGGHSERSVPIGTIEVAVWDLVAKIEQKPLYAVLARLFNHDHLPVSVPCYVGGGWYAPGKGIVQLQEEIQRRMDEGYRVMKIKVGGAPIEEDMARIEAAIKIVGSPRELAVDANAAWQRPRAMEYASTLRPYGLRWLEEPTDPLDYELLSELVDLYDAPIATGENVFSTLDVNNLIRFGRLRAESDIIQIDIPQSYGITQFAQTLRMMEGLGWSRSSVFPHGGNLMTLAIVAGFGLGGCEAYPDVFGAFAGFHDDAKLSEGMIFLSDRPGIGFEGQNDLYQLMQTIVQ
jgi:L-alanine-DL-glutamate epimerase-like enolase superfamily enzyme